jgi:hypothetical protein
VIAAEDAGFVMASEGEGFVVASEEEGFVVASEWRALMVASEEEGFCNASAWEGFWFAKAAGMPQKWTAEGVASGAEDFESVVLQGMQASGEVPRQRRACSVPPLRRRAL